MSLNLKTTTSGLTRRHFVKKSLRWGVASGLILWAGSLFKRSYQQQCIDPNSVCRACFLQPRCSLADSKVQPPSTLKPDVASKNNAFLKPQKRSSVDS